MAEDKPPANHEREVALARALADEANLIARRALRALALRRSGMSMDFNAAFWLRPVEEVVADLQAQNPVDMNGQPLSDDALHAIVQAVQNAVTGNVDEGWTRVEAPGAGTPEDPSPNSLAEAEALEEDGDGEDGG